MKTKFKPLVYQISVFFLSLIFLFVLISCEEVGIFRKPRWVGVLTNDTPYALKIIAYSGNKIGYTYNIAAKNCFEIALSERDLKISEGIFYKERDTVPSAEERVDSVEIFFDNKRRIIQKCQEKKLINCESVDKNLVRLWYENNQVVNKEGNLFFGYLYKFNITITEEDYQLAKEI
jgi:hypothetical protein